MAKVKIIKGDTLTSVSVKKNVSVEALKALNPGVKTVKAGQVINVPKNYGDDIPAPKQVVKTTPTSIQSGGMLSPDKIVPGAPAPSGFIPAYRYGQQQTVIPKPAASAYTGTAGYWGAYNQPNVQSGGMLSPDKNPVVRQPYLGAAGYLNPVYQTPQNTQPSNVPTASTVKLTSPRPTGVFTGDPNDPNTAAWRAYWNNVAQLGGDPNIPAAAPTVMTREEIWQMKAASRRRKMRGMSADELAPSGGYSGGYEPFQYSEQTQSYIPETLVRSITWGI